MATITKTAGSVIVTFRRGEVHMGETGERTTVSKEWAAVLLVRTYHKQADKMAWVSDMLGVSVDAPITSIVEGLLYEHDGKGTENK